MIWWSKLTRFARGHWAEQTATDRLRRAGLTLLSRNYRCARGELDLVMQDGKTIVFVEVRYRSRSDYGSAAESIDSRKQQRLVVAAQHYLQTQPPLAGCDCRFDVVLIRGDARQPSVEWIRNAFQA